MEFLLCIIALAVVIIVVRSEIKKNLEKDNYNNWHNKNAVKKTSKNNNGCFLFIIGLVVLLIFLLGDVFTEDRDYRENTQKEKIYTSDIADVLLAYKYASDFVKNNLKSPLSAKFPNSEQKVKDTKYVGNNTYEIDSFVESKNSFGVMIRTDFKCVICFENGSVICKKIELY